MIFVPVLVATCVHTDATLINGKVCWVIQPSCAPRPVWNRLSPSTVFSRIPYDLYAFKPAYLLACPESTRRETWWPFSLRHLHLRTYSNECMFLTFCFDLWDDDFWHPMCDCVLWTYSEVIYLECIRVPVNIHLLEAQRATRGHYAWRSVLRSDMTRSEHVDHRDAMPGVAGQQQCGADSDLNLTDMCLQAASGQ